MESMEELSVAHKRIRVAEDNYERDYNELILALSQRESKLNKRLNELNRKKHDIAHKNGNIDATDGDLVEINAGGTIVVAKQFTLTQIKGTRLEGLFSGRWDKMLQRDSNGRIFLDVNTTCFQAIVDYLNEMLISSKDSPPSPPSVDDEHNRILQHQLKLFGLLVGLPDSNIIRDEGHSIVLRDWLKEDGSDGGFVLLYQGSRDGLSASAFHSRCDNKGCTLTIIETTDGKVIGGYSNASWASTFGYSAANKAFLFALSGSGILCPWKMKLKKANSLHAIRNHSSFGPTFGGGCDMLVSGPNVMFTKLGYTYYPGPLSDGASFTIKEIEVFQVNASSPPARFAYSTENQSNLTIQAAEQVARFSADINDAINRHHACLLRAEAEVAYLELSFQDEQTFIEKFASGDAKDTIALNVSGTMMATTRSTLCNVEDSVLAQQFDDSKWTEQGCRGTRVEGWTPDEVHAWAKGIDGLPEEVGIILYDNKITGQELLALSLDGLKMMGIERAGTMCLLLKEIEKLEKSCRDFVTLIEHSPYCFGKILDYLRLKQLHSLGLLTTEPTLPEVRDAQKKRFEKVVNYYFPGDSARAILGYSHCVL
ncbi:hypothetical protein ACHAW5_003310 [Stephanodiscus triporus]|uniref:TLDc domain-containing protein n=1 Tax=Stephanodiscus triporus TaxID=2934178 RepID=A0ABD3QCG7_9STRA